MTSKDRVRRTVLYEETDRFPASTFATSYEYEMRMAKSLGYSALEPMYRALGIDTWRSRKLPLCMGVQPLGTPFADVHTVDKVMEYRFPEEYDVNGMIKEMEAHEEFSIIAGTIPEGYTPGIWPLYLSLCGQERGLMYLREQPVVAKAMIECITDYWMHYMRAVLQCGLVDIWVDMNDFGTQQSLFISPQDFRLFIKPSLRKMVAIAHEYGAMYMQHSCGSIRPLIDDFTEMGIDILNPIQVSARGMDIRLLRRGYYGSFAFMGGIDTQHFLPNASIGEVRMSVQKMKRLFGTGYILCASQELREDIPLLNAIAMFDEDLR